MTQPLQQIQEFLMGKPLRPLVALIGATATGKTALSIDAALALSRDGIPVTVINADSRQLYRCLDIGTAKITESEMRGVPHELLSVLDPREPTSIAWYQREARRSIDRAHAEGRIPFLVGGSMLYVSSIVDALRPLPSDPTLRAEIEAAYDADGGRAVYEELLLRDPSVALSIPRQNRRYVVRRLERLKLGELGEIGDHAPSPAPYDVCIIGLRRSRSELLARITERTAAMFRAGWADEVRGLLRDGYTASDPGLMSHGYREIIDALHNERDPLTCCVEIIRAAMAYAKRHDTWWNRDPRVHWFG